MNYKKGVTVYPMVKSVRSMLPCYTLNLNLNKIT